MNESLLSLLPLAVILGFLIALALGWRWMRSKKEKRKTELRFKNVFAMMSEDRREALIDSHMQKTGGDRYLAMRSAMEELSRDLRRY